MATLARSTRSRRLGSAAGDGGSGHGGGRTTGAAQLLGFFLLSAGAVARSFGHGRRGTGDQAVAYPLVT